MATTKASQWRYPPELRERGIRMMQETIAQAGGERYRGGDPGREAAWDWA